jgi:hypothetical protein
MTPSPGTSIVFIPQPPSSSPPIVTPRRGGIDSIYGLYLDESPVNDLYNHRVTSRLTYRYATQCRYVQTISLIEQQHMNACESVTTLKFDGRLEATVGSPTEICNECFLTLIGQ